MLGILVSWYLGSGGGSGGGQKQTVSSLDSRLSTLQDSQNMIPMIHPIPFYRVYQIFNNYDSLFQLAGGHR